MLRLVEVAEDASGAGQPSASLLCHATVLGVVQQRTRERYIYKTLPTCHDQEKAPCTTLSFDPSISVAWYFLPFPNESLVLGVTVLE